MTQLTDTHTRALAYPRTQLASHLTVKSDNLAATNAPIPTHPQFAT